MLSKQCRDNIPDIVYASNMRIASQIGHNTRLISRFIFMYYYHSK